jgi:hypothetical protein
MGGRQMGTVTDEEVFGTAAPTSAKVLSDDEVFGSAPKTLTDDEVFGAATPTAASPGVGSYVKQAGKSLLEGAAGMVSGPLKGAGAMISGLPGAGSGVVAEDPFYRAGQAVEDTVKFTPEPGFEGESWTKDIAGGVGSVGGAIGLSLLNAPLAMGSFLLGGAGEAADRAQKAKATDEQTRSAAMLGNVAGATDVVDALLPTLGGAGKAASAVGRVARRVAIGAGAEGAQEGAQQAAQNLIAQQVYKLDQDLMEGVQRNATVGAIVGGGVRAVIPDQKETTAPAPTAEQLEAASRQLAEQMRMASPEVTQSAASIITPEIRPTFFSQLARVASEKVSDGSADQVLATLRNAPGVKAEEIEATGLHDFLSAQPGRVSKQEVVEFLEERQVQVEEVLQGASPRLNELRNLDAMNKLPPELMPELISLTESTRRPEFNGYTIPGPKENYRELLLTMLDPRQGLINELSGSREQDDVDLKNQLTAERDAATYAGPHWGTPNVLAHVRFSDRVDATGQKVLFVEEIQSDWHQAGRKSGYRGQAVEPRPDRYVIEERKLDDGPSHFVVKDLEGQYGTSGFQTREAAQVMLDKKNQHEAAVRERKLAGRVPDAPFKSSWPELALKRMIRYAADNGYTRVAITNGAAIAEVVAPGDEDVRRGNTEFYDRVLPSIGKKWMKKLGGSISQSELAAPVSYTVGPSNSQRWLMLRNGREVQSFDTRAEAESMAAKYQAKYASQAQRITTLDIPPRAATIVQQGLPLFSAARQDVDVKASPTVKPEMRVAATRIKDVLTQLTKEFDIAAPVRIQLHDTLKAGAGFAQIGGQAVRYSDGSYTIQLNVGAHHTASQLFASASHEFGHVLMWEKFARADQSTQVAIREAYSRYRESMDSNTNLGELWQLRDNAVVNYFGMRGSLGGETASTPLYALSPQHREYWSSFDEWFAEQVAQWATTAPKAGNIVERFFKQLGTTLKILFQRTQERFGYAMEPAAEVREWLDSFIKTAPPMGVQVYSALDTRTQARNQGLLDGIDDTLVAAPRQAESEVLRSVFGKLFNNHVPRHLQQHSAIVDRVSWFSKLTLSAYQIAERNPHIEPLQRYTETLRFANVDQSKILDAYTRIAKEWEALGKEGNDPLVGLIDDVTNMVYRTTTEVQQGIARHPTPAELQALVAKHKVSAKGLGVFLKINKIFDVTLGVFGQVAIDEANATITDPAVLATKLAEIQARMAALRSKPYFPFMRYGNHYVLVKDAADNIVHREHVEKSGFRTAKQRQSSLVKALEESYGPTYTVTPRVLDETALPMVGIPKVMLDALASKLTLNAAQMEALKDLSFEMAPAQSFKHRFQQKSYTKGYSQDFKRSFANYGFHGSTWYKKARYSGPLRQAIRDLRNSAESVPNPVKRDELANYLADHLEKGFLHPSQDFIAIKSLAVLWTLGFVPMSAMVNLSQTPLVTAPYLSAKFGGGPMAEANVAKILAKNMTKMANFYKKGAYDNSTSFEKRAIEYGIRTGRLDQTLAAELAQWSQGSNLSVGLGGKGPSRLMHNTMEKAMWMFEMAEKWNRRASFAAALELAEKYPAGKFVTETSAKYAQETAKLVAMGFTQGEANSIVTASHVVDQTQFIASQDARPRLMRGKLGSLFLFMRFLQGVLFLNANNKRDYLPRATLIMLAVGGLQGLPGYDDLEEMLKALGWQMFGKQFDLTREIKTLITNLADADTAESLLEGTSAKSFGVPHLLELLGHSTGLWKEKDLLSFNFSGAVGTGNIVPIEWGKLFGPPIDPTDKVVGQSAVKASGAMGSLANNFYKFLASKEDRTAQKQLELIMPRSMRLVSKAWRAYDEEGVTGKDGSKIIGMNRASPRDMLEVAGMAMGMQPARLASRWEELRDFQEVDKFKKMERQMLLGQMSSDTAKADPEARTKVIDAIREYNQNLPDWGRAYAISADTIRKSMQTKARATALHDAGLPTAKMSMGTQREMQRINNTTTIVEERRVR